MDLDPSGERDLDAVRLHGEAETADLDLLDARRGVVKPNRIVLVMVVKNEAHVLEKCLRSVLPHIDAWVIVVDTRTTDSTREIVRDVIAGVPGELYDRDFVDISACRNEALELAKPFGDYALLMDADDTLEMPSLPVLTKDLYLIRLVAPGGSSIHWRELLIRLDRGIHFEGIMHEYVRLPPGGSRDRLTKGIYHYTETGSRSHVEDKYGKDALVLERAAAEGGPLTAQYLYMAGECFVTSQKPGQAIDAYERFLKVGNPATEEFWWAKVKLIGLRHDRGEVSDFRAVRLLTDLAEERSDRAEAIYYGAIVIFRQDPQRAYDLAKRAYAIPSPMNAEIFKDDVYMWEAGLLYAKAAIVIGLRDEARKVCEEVLRRDLLDYPRLRVDEVLATCGKTK